MIQKDTYPKIESDVYLFLHLQRENARNSIKEILIVYQINNNRIHFWPFSVFVAAKRAKIRILILIHKVGTLYALYIGREEKFIEKRKSIGVALL